MPTDERSYRCPSCRGEVAIPTNWRRIDIERVRSVHERSCPSRGVMIKEDADGETT